MRWSIVACLLAASAPAAQTPSPEVLRAVREFAGVGVPQNRPAACAAFERLADVDDGMAASLAGDCYFHGQGVARDYRRSKALYERAIALGFRDASCALGNQYFDGLGVPADSKRGLQLCQHAAMAGSANAQADLGGRYLRGVGLPKSFPDARDWLNRAVAQNHAKAAIDLGTMLANGDGGPRDPVGALRVWEIAARQRHPAAAINMGVAATRMLRDGGADAATIPAAERAAIWTGLAMRTGATDESRVQAAVLHTGLFNALPREAQARVMQALEMVPARQSAPR